MEQKKINATVVYNRNYQAYHKSKCRYIINQGGARSSKTYSIIQFLISLCIERPNLRVTIARKTLPTLKSSALKDFKEILISLGLYHERQHNKTEQIFTFSNGSEVDFFGIDDGQKARGRKRDILYCNEANELTHDDFIQLNMRTKERVFIDYNPSDNQSWLYELLNEPESILVKSTYVDNNFLTDVERKTLEDLIKVDENYYKVYVLGERPLPHSRIYTHFKTYDLLPPINTTVYGLDFGYNHPSVLVECSFIKNQVYIKELFYQSNMTAVDIAEEMDRLNIPKDKTIYCDTARPEIIEELKRKGFRRSKGADKSVKSGIDKVKSMEIYVHIDSSNVIKESKLYSWKTKDENILDEPVKANDDAMDAIRYAIYTHLKGGAFNEFYTKIFRF